MDDRSDRPPRIPELVALPKTSLRVRRQRRPVVTLRPAALQIFVFERGQLRGTELFGIGRPVTLGRGPEAQLHLDADTVSRAHARIWEEDGRVVIRDLDSANGTFVDRCRIEGDAILSPRDEVQVGPFLLRARALTPQPLAERRADPEAATRIEAILGAEHTGGTRELPVELEGTPHLRLLEAARARQASPIRGGRTAGPVGGDRTASPRPDIGPAGRAQTLNRLLSKLEDRGPSRLPWVDEQTSDTEHAPELEHAPEGAEGPPAGPPDARAEEPRRAPSTKELAFDLASPLPLGASTGALPDALIEGPESLGGPTVPDVIAEPVLPELPDAEPTEAAPSRARGVLPPPVEPAARRSAPREREDRSSRVAARLVTPSNLEVRVRPAPPRTFDAVEITANRDGELLDIAVLRKGGQQYVLGHPTPQGKLAPFGSHEGLRLVRLHPDTSADLVFPGDVRGWLERGADRVPLQDLTEGRRYSCLRLELGDVAELTLGPRSDGIRYRVSFRARPTTLFGRSAP